MRSSILRWSLLLLVAAPGCIDEGPGLPDLRRRDTSPKHDVTPPYDLAQPAEGAPPPDGTQPVDQGRAPDQGAKQDKLSKVDQGAKPDVSKPDQGAKPDTGPVVPAGPIVITELMVDPDAVADTSGEWIELYNPGTQGIDLKGWTLKDDGGESHVIASTLVVPAKGYVVLGRNTTTSVNGGVPVDYKYTGFTLTNSGDEIELRDGKGAMIDRVAYGPKWFTFAKYSTALKGLALDNALNSSWCFGAAAWTGSAGDYGTPGSANACPPNMAPSGCTHTPTMTMSFSSHLCAPMIAQWKLITIRNGHDTSPKLGEWIRLSCTGYGFELEAEISLARLTTYGQITTQEILDDGFKDQAEMLAALQQYYPGITLSSNATVFRWKTPALCNWP